MVMRVCVDIAFWDVSRESSHGMFLVVYSGTNHMGVPSPPLCATGA